MDQTCTLCNVDFYGKKKLKMSSFVISEEGRVQAGRDGNGHQGAELWKGKYGPNRQAGKILIEEYFFIPCL